MNIWRLTVSRLSIVDMDAKIELSPRTLKALLDQAYQQGKLDAAPQPQVTRNSDTETFKNIFGNIFSK
jgi:hypothetical protein